MVVEEGIDDDENHVVEEVHVSMDEVELQVQILDVSEKGKEGVSKDPMGKEVSALDKDDEYMYFLHLMNMNMMNLNSLSHCYSSSFAIS